MLYCPLVSMGTGRLVFMDGKIGDMENRFGYGGCRRPRLGVRTKGLTRERRLLAVYDRQGTEQADCFDRYCVAEKKEGLAKVFPLQGLLVVIPQKG